VSAVWLAERPRLLGLAYRVLGSWHDAEDVVSQAWLRLSAQPEGHVDRPEAWLTTVTTRLAIDRGRQLQARREDYVGPWLPEPVATELLPEESVERRESLSLALLRLMDALSPEDRAIYVLRHAFDVPYAEIAAVVARSEAACRQVVRRASARLAAVDVPSPADAAVLQGLVAAISTGDVAGAVALLSEDAVLWTDGGGVVKAALRPILGPGRIVRFGVGVTGAAGLEPPRLVSVNGGPALVFSAPDGSLRCLVLEVRDGLVRTVQLHGNPVKLGALDRPA